MLLLLRCAPWPRKDTSDLWHAGHTVHGHDLLCVSYTLAGAIIYDKHVIVRFTLQQTKCSC